MSEPQGERGKQGDHGQDGRDGLNGIVGRQGLQGEVGEQGRPGEVALVRTQDPWVKRGLVVLALLATAMALIALSVTFRQQSSSSVDRRLARDTQVKLDETQAKLDEIQADRAARAEITDRQYLKTECRNRFIDDALLGLSGSMVELNHLFGQLAANSLAATDPAVTPEIREQNRQLLLDAIASGNAQADSVQAAVDAFQAYVTIDPAPEDCPYPEVVTTP